MNKHTFLLGANLARALGVALALVLIVACKPDNLSGRKTTSQGADQSALLIAASQPVSSVIAVWGVTPAPTLTPVPLPGPSALWSPDGRYFATTDIYGGIVGEVNSQRVFTASMANGVEAWRWTNDSRFVIFRWRHPHNNSYTYVFDAHAWKLIWSTNGCKFTGRADLLMWENCGDYPVALSPNAPRFLMMNGKLIELPDWRQVELLPDFPVGQVSVLGESPHGDLSAWSPDGSALAFVVQLSFDPPGFALYSAQGDGAQVRQVTSLANYPKSLQWSSDSKQVMVTTGPFDSDVSDLRYVLDIATGQGEVERITALTPTPPPLPTPTLATPPATPTPPSDRDFYTLQRLTTTAGGAYRPAVSPDGQRVAYASERNGNWDIYVLDPTTNVETRLTDDPLNDMAPSWSPDGARIAYQHNVPSASGPVFVDQIVMNADGLNKIVVSSGAAWNGNDPPAWSPAGDRIAFADRGEVVVVSVADQREVTRFKPTPGSAYADPIWIDQPFIAFTNNGTPVVGDTRDGTVGGVYYDTPGLYGVPVENAAWSPDGRFIAIQSGAVVHVVNGETPSAALFTIDTRTPPSDLLSVSWLPDSSGLVVVAAIDGQPDLYLVRLNLRAIEDFWSIAPIAAATPVSGLQPPPTSPPMPTPFPTPTNRWETPAAWRAVVDDQHIVEWRVYADNEPLRQLMANAPSDHRYWGSRP